MVGGKLVVETGTDHLGQHFTQVMQRASRTSYVPLAWPNKAGTWFDETEIYEWFAANLRRVREPSLRHYVRARELKAAEMDWTEVLAAEDDNKRARLAAELLVSDAYGSTAERVQAFIKQGGGCRATFFNHRRKLGGGTGG